MAPQRVPIGRPSRAENPIVVATLCPSSRRTGWRRCRDGRRSPCPSARLDRSPQDGRYVVVGQPMEAVAPHAALAHLARQGEQLAISGWLWWKAVSKQATCGSPGRRRRTIRIGSRLWGWCRGASGHSVSKLGERRRRRRAPGLRKACRHGRRGARSPTSLRPPDARAARDEVHQRLLVPETDRRSSTSSRPVMLSRRVPLTAKRAGRPSPSNRPLKATLGSGHQRSKTLELEARRAGVEDERDGRHGSDLRDGEPWRAGRRPTSEATAQEASRVDLESARLVRMIGTRAPSTMPAASASARKVRLLASMLPASRSGTTSTLARPGHRRLDLLDLRGAEIDGVVERQRAVEDAAGDLAAVGHLAQAPPPRWSRAPSG